MSPARPAKMIRENGNEASEEPRKSASSGKSSETWSKNHETISVVSPTFSELMPRAKDDSIAERRQKIPPAQLTVSSQHRSGTRPQRSQIEHVDPHISPLSPKKSNSMKANERPSSSTYSASALELHPPRPLNISSNRRSQPRDGTDDGVIDIYNDWTQFYSSGVSPLSPDPVHYQSQEGPYPRRSKSLAEGMRRQRSPVKASHDAEYQRLSSYPAEAVSESPMFSPLPLYFRGQDFPTVKRGGKTLIGNNGWLEKTGQEGLELETHNKTAPKKTGIFDSIKKIAKDMVGTFHFYFTPKI